MKITQYVRAEQAIVGADSGTIRERWLWGLRLLQDPERLAPAGGLRHGAADWLIEGARAKGLNLSALEIRRRLQCARTYPYESQIDHAVIDFKTWHNLIEAGFPAYEPELNEPLADYRTKDEKGHDRPARRLLPVVGEQGSLFPLDQFEPAEATVKDLVGYAETMAALTVRFAERDQLRQEYLDKLIAATGGDLTMTWADAHRAAFGSDIDE